MKRKSKVRQAKGSGCLMVGFFAVFAVVGCGVFYFMTFKPIANIVVARGWVETECLIQSSQVAESPGSDGSTYRVEMTYTYEVDWEPYEGNRYDFSTGSTSGYQGKARVVEAHPPDLEVTCWVDPEDPARSVINRDPGHFLWWGLFPLPFMAVGLGGLAFCLLPVGRRMLGVRGQERKASRFKAAPAAPRGPLELAAEHSPAMRVVGTLFVAVFWNGIVSIFLFVAVIPGFKSGDIEWFTTLILIPFVLVGMVLIALFFYQVLAVFNPRPRLTLAGGHLTPGSDSTLSWNFGGRSGRLQKLTIELEGREEVRYRRGTKTYSDEHVFFSEQLVSEGRFGTIHRGSVSIEIPERTMPSFKASNNEIEWRLKVRGEVPFWPDVADDFPVTVHPS